MNMLNKDVVNLGQVFTPISVVDEMIWLIKNHGTILEPSCGDWAFIKHLSNAIGIEIDERMYNIAKQDNSHIMNMDFFDFEISNTFDTIIGNPPYVRFQDINETTKNKLDMKLFDKRSNLYLFFIYKSIQHLNDHGELIFITPRDFLKATSSINLNKFIYDHGTITDIIDMWDQKIFGEFCPNTVIRRFEKGNFSRQTNVHERFIFSNWQLMFTNNEYNINFSDIFFVKVWAVSWADPIFIITEEIIQQYKDIPYLEFVWSFTAKKGTTKKMLYNQYHPYLDQYKDILINRKIKKFNETNRRTWGRWFYESTKKRIYVNGKTRNNKPFFINTCKNYDGSILAIFPINQDIDIQELCDELNQVDRNELWFVCNWRFLFSQKSLENTKLPDNFKKFLPKQTKTTPFPF